MKRIIALTIAVSLIVSCRPTPPAYGGCKVKVREKVVENVVAVPVAIAAGVPVAEVAPYQYSYQATYGQPVVAVDVHALAKAIAAELKQPKLTPESADNRREDEAVAAERQLSSQRPSATSAVPSAVAQNCVKCHSGAAPKGKLDLTNLTALTCEQKLKAIRKVLAEEMPKDAKLDPDTAGAVLSELAN